MRPIFNHATLPAIGMPAGNSRFASGCGNTDYRNNVLYKWGYTRLETYLNGID